MEENLVDGGEWTFLSGGFFEGAIYGNFECAGTGEGDSQII